MSVYFFGIVKWVQWV